MAEFECDTCHEKFADIAAIAVHIAEKHPDGQGSNKLSDSEESVLAVLENICVLAGPIVTMALWTRITKSVVAHFGWPWVDEAIVGWKAIDAAEAKHAN